MVLRGYFGMFTFFIFYAFKNGDGFFFNSRLNIRQDILDISIILLLKNNLEKRCRKW